MYELNKSLAAAAAVDHSIHVKLANAQSRLAITRSALEAFMFEALTEADAAERVSELFQSLNAALEPLIGSPHFVIDEHMDIAVKFGANQTAYKVKPSEISK